MRDKENDCTHGPSRAPKCFLQHQHVASICQVTELSCNPSSDAVCSHGWITMQQLPDDGCHIDGEPPTVRVLLHLQCTRVEYQPLPQLSSQQVIDTLPHPINLSIARAKKIIHIHSPTHQRSNDNPMHTSTSTHVCVDHQRIRTQTPSNLIHHTPAQPIQLDVPQADELRDCQAIAHSRRRVQPFFPKPFTADRAPRALSATSDTRSQLMPLNSESTPFITSSYTGSTSFLPCLFTASPASSPAAQSLTAPFNALHARLESSLNGRPVFFISMFMMGSIILGATCFTMGLMRSHTFMAPYCTFSSPLFILFHMLPPIVIPSTCSATFLISLSTARGIMCICLPMAASMMGAP